MWFSNKALYCLVSTIDFCLSDADWTDPTQRQSEVEMPVKLQIIVSACSLLSAVYCLFRKKLPKIHVFYEYEKDTFRETDPPEPFAQGETDILTSYNPAVCKAL